DDVPIRIVQGKEVFDELTVSKSGKAVRIAAGSYKIEIGGQIDGLALDDGSVTLQRGGNDVVRIVKVAAAASVLRSDRQPTDIVGKRSKAPQTRLKSEVHDNDRPLLAAVNEFNSSHKFNDQPPLTEDEVVACISWLLNHEEPPVSKSRPDLRLLVEQRQLPAGWAITATESSPMFGDDAASQLTINLEWTSEDRAIPIRQWAVSPPESFLEPTETATDENGIPLQAAISAFNASHHTINGIRQPPLTLKEVLAAIAIWKQKRNEAGVDDATFDNFKRIARTHYLPAEARFQVIPRFETSSGVYSIWSVTIVMPQVGKPEWTYAFSIRRQFTALNAELASQIHWGKPAENGLQAGFRLIPAQEVYRVGQVVDVEFLFRSIYGQAPVSLPNFFTHQEAHLRRSRTNDELEVIEDQQEKIVGGWISAGVTEEPIARKGQRIGFTDNPKADFKTKVGTKLIVSPTGSQLSLSFTVANPADGAEGQSLETGVVQFKVVADDLSQASREVTNGIDATASPVPVASTGNMSDESTKQSSSLARRKTVNNLTRIAIALHRYHELHGHLPPATILGKDGKGGPPHSWRVELLPLLGDQELYDQYHFDEPWESEHNKGLLAKMPDVYRSPLDKADSVNTSCFGVVSDDVSKRAAELAEMRDQAESGPDSEYAGEYGNDEPQPRYEQYTPEATVFWKQRGAAFIDMLDGTSNCIAVIEAKRDIPWTKPEDIAYSADHPLPNFGGWFEQGIHAAFADGMVKFLASYNDEQTIRNLLTISDGQFVEPLLVRRLQIHGAIAVPEDEPDVAAGPETYQVPGGPLLLIQSNKKSVLTEADIIEVAATTDPNNPSEGDIVAMTLTEEAGKRFLEATTKLSEQGTRGHMVITFDRKVVSAPRVLTPIGNKLTITGTIDAKKLAEQIQAAIDDIEAVDLTPSANAEDDDVAPIEELPQQEEAGTRSNTDEADAPANACKSETSEFEMRLTEQHGFLTAKQAVSLDDAVAAFNQLAGQSEVGRKQSKLTADEVIASIRNWIDRNAGKVATRKELQEVIETKTLQPGHQLSFTSRYISERHVFDVWEIRFGDKGSVAWLRIRDILLASRPKTPQEEELWKQIRAEMAKSFDHVRLGGLGVSRERSPGEQSRFEQLLDRAYQRSAGVSGTRSPNDEAALPKYRPHRATRRAQVEERIHEKLRQSTLKSIRKSPLDDVLKQLANFHDIKLIFDPLWLEDATPDREQPVSADLGELSLGAALDFILEPLGMSYIVREDEVRITSLERAASYQYERVHELPPPLKGREAEIIQALTTKISPEKWWRIGGEYVVSATDGCLTISANREVHEAAAALLEELQKPKQQQASPELESAWDEVNSQK
ncbi:MAG: DUF1559 domain-containing protein, partial [Planctomycetaceae bacterium]|nr:DUF1559 domain-containing protein [Planctomycetaceae bacterium]